ncbi:XisI protein [Spirulina major]|uniref:XisI protein n=1 Tax=Spirulina major TaxID=270636 RepID=UPI00093334A2|nr:XisI protein [Spirulina major]
MEALNYKGLIKQIILNYVNAVSGETMQPIETQVVFDDEQGRYLVLNVGWQEEDRVFGCAIYVEVKVDEIWIQRDFTEPGIAYQLMNFGVPESCIMLGYRSPAIREIAAADVTIKTV